jgi:biopolymer transport protein ExbB
MPMNPFPPPNQEATMPPATLLLQRIHRLGAALLLAITLCAGMATTPAQAQGVSPPVVAAPALTPTRDITSIRPPAGDHADNPYGLRALWAQGDTVARLTLLVLAVMSLGSWYVLVSKLLEQRRMTVQAKAATKAFAGAEALRQSTDQLEKDSPYRFIAETSLDAVRRHDSVATQVDLNTWMAQGIERAVGTVQGRTQDGLAVLATVGATAPFVGLFGTVWGIYNALVKIGASGQASIDRVAGPVGEALIMTALGLAVAVPAVLGYNWLVRRNRRAMEGVRGFGSDLHTRVLVSVARSRRTADAAPADGAGH